MGLNIYINRNKLLKKAFKQLIASACNLKCKNKHAISLVFHVGEIYYYSTSTVRLAALRTPFLM